MPLHPNIDPELAEGLEQAFLPPVDLARMGHDELPGVRGRMRAAFADMPPLVAPGVLVEDLRVPGPDGDPDIRLRVYRPEDADGPLPVLYWMHGGGMVLGMVEMDDGTLSRYVREAGCAAVSVEYRLAPENPHPAPVEDCYAGLVWTAKNAGEIGVDPARLAVGGSSAGGGLAAGTVLLARDRGGPQVVFQMLLSPMLDDRNVTPSSREFDEAVLWSRGENLFGWTALLGADTGTTAVSPYAAPARAADLSGLPPAYIDVGELEVFRDECIDHAQRLLQAGVSTEFHLFPGAFHGFDAVLPDAAVSRRAVAGRMAALRRALAG
ncbi:esterase [Sphaerisporangium krabiense]|uniref:Acetyl esterase/lipase n=1 Tax=Sphaerisporangium krabiense TaxID=763782 RepID=A0A7W8ZBX4_9ACTN|nr:alpha/beta hydrolase [Sphaerisporangium krabiense]MBB5630838.1 acetyl esterase/lipase [Sphaerisporangium krabiense]GII65479.1 esterase [Sphaerisporangium krabiense]